jgi:biotin operon repressor
MRAVDPRLMARFLRTLRKARRPICGHDLALRFNIWRVRTIGEMARAARLKGLGVTYVPGQGYVMAKSRAERLACAARMERAARAELRAARALRLGRSRQSQIPATRQRRVA